ncbi:hypothetical protein, partial [Hydrogenophaga pseudoflava]|uniref:hypothetical protein n=1 Tax=Hydrogenophaga pseudoflava TaxID=47421 RepID=UPI001C3F9B5E
TAAFLAGAFFAVAIVFSLIKLQRALRAANLRGSDSGTWRRGCIHERRQGLESCDKALPRTLERLGQGFVVR